MNFIRNTMLAAGLLPMLFAACKTTKTMSSSTAFYKVGHRGTRGLMPENTIPAMIKGIENGVNTIEFDVHITKDGQVLVYHDESFDPAYTTMPDGKDIPAASRKDFIFYRMDYSQIRQFIIGEKPYPAFPQQQRMRSYAPLLPDMIDSVEAYTRAHHLAPVYYLLEIKSSEKTDGLEQPAPEEFVDKILALQQVKSLGKRLLVQSFDMRPLQVIHKKYPEVILGFLTGDKKLSVTTQLDKLGFTPAFYNPYYSMVTPELLKTCHDKKIQVVPWTVQEMSEMKKLKAMGVDGIITDYPDRLTAALK